MTRRLGPDVVLSDLMINPVDGIEVARQVATSSPDTRTIIHSVQEDAGYVSISLREEARGYVLKE